MKKNIILLVGQSGTGKTTVANLLNKYEHMKILDSYTTRPERYPGEKGHVFIDEDQFDIIEDELCAYTKINGYRYGATNSQVDESDIYVIDPAGVKYFKEHYKGKRNIIVVRLTASLTDRYRRMRGRGDSLFKTLQRLIHDAYAFRNYPYDITIAAINVMPGARLLADEILWKVERFKTNENRN